MRRVTEDLPEGTLVAVDTPLFIYHLEANPNYAAVVRPFIAELSRGSIRGVTSVLTAMEVTVKPLQLGRPEVADDYEVFLWQHPNLNVLDVNRVITRKAAELRAMYRLRPVDSIQVATALDARAAVFITNDRGLQRVRDIPVVILDDFRGA